MVFLSLDLEADEMRKYLNEPKLKCPAVRFDEIEGIKKALRSIYDSDEDGVPIYIVMDRNGKVLSRTIEEPKKKILELKPGNKAEKATE